MIRRMLAAVVTLAAAGFCTASVTAEPRLAPATCADIRAAAPRAGDGDYLLRTGSRIVPVYCHDMAGAPREYVTLHGINLSQYTSSGAAWGTSVRTTFTKVRLDPATLTVDINDLTFATSTGRLQHDGTVVTSMAYTTAMSCAFHPIGIGRVDLTGTAFVLDDTFATAGGKPTGSAIVSADGRSAELLGGGICGWISAAPFIYEPMNPTGTDFRLELACASHSMIDLLRGRGCLNLAG